MCDITDLSISYYCIDKMYQVLKVMSYYGNKKRTYSHGSQLTEKEFNKACTIPGYTENC